MRGYKDQDIIVFGNPNGSKIKVTLDNQLPREVARIKQTFLDNDWLVKSHVRGIKKNPLDGFTRVYPFFFGTVFGMLVQVGIAAFTVR